MALNQRDQEIAQLRDYIEKNKKGISKESSKLKKSAKDRDRELAKAKAELGLQKSQNDDYRARIDELLRQRSSNGATSSIQYVGRPSTSSQQQPQQSGDDSNKVKEMSGVIQ